MKCDVQKKVVAQERHSVHGRVGSLEYLVSEFTHVSVHMSVVCECCCCVVWHNLICWHCAVVNDERVWVSALYIFLSLSLLRDFKSSSPHLMSHFVTTCSVSARRPVLFIIFRACFIYRMRRKPRTCEDLRARAYKQQRSRLRHLSLTDHLCFPAHCPRRAVPNSRLFTPPAFLPVVRLTRQWRLQAIAFSFVILLLQRFWE